MSQPTPNAGGQENRIDEIIAAYCKEVEEGKSPGQAAYLARYPEAAAELKLFFADQARFHALAQHVTAPQAPPVGGVVKYFGDYELLEVIAQGGMGIVYRAQQKSLNREVALKMILAGGLASPDAVQRFHTEAEAAAALDHPHIVPIYEVGEYHGQHYFSMKLVEGGSLASLLRQTPTEDRNLRALVRLLIPICQAVHHAHQRGILHRDLKPGNVLLQMPNDECRMMNENEEIASFDIRHSSSGIPLVTDFGLAKRLQSDATATRSGAILGTPAYMAPEQAAGSKDVTTLADVYSLGAILYETLTGRPPFQGESLFEVLQQVKEAAPLPPTKLNPAVDRDLELICLKCLAKEPGQRYATAGALAGDLENWLAGEPLSVQPPSAARLAWLWLRRNVKAAVWLVLLSLAAGGLPALSMSTAALGSILIRATKAAQEIPNENVSYLTRVNWRPILDFLTSWWMVPFYGAGWLLLMFLGLFATRLVRSRNVWNDLSVGIGTGALGGFVALMLGMGAGTVLAMSTVVQLQDTMDVCAGCFHVEPAMGPYKHPSELLYERYPSLQQIQPQERAGRFMAKLVGENTLGVILGIWYGAMLSIFSFIALAMTQALAAGWLWRRFGTWKRVLLPYIELTCLFGPVLVKLFEFLFFGPFVPSNPSEQGFLWGKENQGLLLLSCSGLCTVWFVLHGWPWWRRWMVYAAILGPTAALYAQAQPLGWLGGGEAFIPLGGWVLTLIFLSLLYWEWRRPKSAEVATTTISETVAYNDGERTDV